jgi:uncharacterized membrane protein YqjE
VADTDEAPRPASLADAIFRLGGTLVALLRTRLELATVEFEEERERATELLVLVLSAVLLGLFALLFASVFVIVWFWDTNRLPAIAGVAVFYLALAALAVVRLQQRRREKPSPFAATLGELGEDVAALRRDS